MRIDVFTLVPHAYAWLTEQRPVANVLGGELELRLFNYRDSTPLRAGQVDDEPYGGGAGMVLRVDVVAAALEAAYGAEPPGPVIALTPKGRQLTQAVVPMMASIEKELGPGSDWRFLSNLMTVWLLLSSMVACSAMAIATYVNATAGARARHDDHSHGRHDEYASGLADSSQWRRGDASGKPLYSSSLLVDVLDQSHQ